MHRIASEKRPLVAEYFHSNVAKTLQQFYLAAECFILGHSIARESGKDSFCDGNNGKLSKKMESCGNKKTYPEYLAIFDRDNSLPSMTAKSLNS